jgi:hypothetical protein
MDTVESVATAKQTLYKLSRPSKTFWLVAHNGKDRAHVVELPQGCECLTGLGTLEKCADEKAAQERAEQFGWKAPVELSVVK